MFDHAYGKTQGHEFAHLATKRTTGSTRSTGITGIIRITRITEITEITELTEITKITEITEITKITGPLAPVIFERPSGQIGVALEKGFRKLVNCLLSFQRAQMEMCVVVALGKALGNSENVSVC